MKEETIKSVTNCPTCNSVCKVEGNMTHYYVPIAKYTDEQVKEIAEKFALYIQKSKQTEGDLTGWWKFWKEYNNK